MGQISKAQNAILKIAFFFRRSLLYLYIPLYTYMNIWKNIESWRPWHELDCCITLRWLHHASKYEIISIIPLETRPSMAVFFYLAWSVLDQILVFMLHVLGLKCHRGLKYFGDLNCHETSSTINICHQKSSNVIVTFCDNWWCLVIFRYFLWESYTVNILG